MATITLATAQHFDAPSWMRMPYAASGMTIGLFGGSFNPPHAGHLNASKQALIRLGLHQVWWMVTPGNPLKDHSELAPLRARVQAAQNLAHNPRIVVTALETLLTTSYTAASIQAILERYPAVRFVWLMGADNLAQFHQWHRWQDIAMQIPMAIIDRPASHYQALSSPAAHKLSAWRLDEIDAPLLSNLPPPAWVYLHGPLSYLSSSAIRDKNTTVWTK